MVQRILRVFLHHHAVRKFDGVVLIDHRKRVAAVGCNLICFQHLQRHLETRIVVCFSFPRNIIQMIKPQNPCVHLSRVAVALADIFALQDRHRLKAFGGCRFCLVNIRHIGPAVNCLGGQVDESPFGIECVSGQKIGQIRRETDRLSSCIAPVIVGIIGPEKNHKIRVYV